MSKGPQKKEKQLSWEELQAFVKGKMLLVGLTFYSTAGEELDSYQTHGAIQQLDDEGFFHVLRKDMSTFMMPHDNETFMHADPGLYTEEETGIEIEDPEFIMSWDVEVESAENMDEIKKFGFLEE